VVAVVLDDQEHAASVVAEAHRCGHVLDVLIDVDLGMGEQAAYSSGGCGPNPPVASQSGRSGRLGTNL
jgi:hypothetical protein